MPRICALFTHFSSSERTLTCLQRLGAQTRQPDSILLINNSTPDDPVLPAADRIVREQIGDGILHILQMESNLGNAGGCAHGINHAFQTLGADFVWVLDDDSWPRPASLENLLAAPADASTVRMSLVVDPAKGDELSWPLTLATGIPRAPWKNITSIAELPTGDIIPSRGGWLGALYPRAAWQKTGVPTPELFIRGEDEEYPWKVRQAGFRFVTVRTSPLEHPSARVPLIHFEHSHHSFFYEPGLAPSRAYYKVRNWAWLQRLKHPRGYGRRLAAALFYIILSLGAMLRSDELTPRRVYTLFRAMHNGYYGKLRPY